MHGDVTGRSIARMSPYARRPTTTDENLGVLGFAIEHLLLILAGLAALWLVDRASNDARDGRKNAALIATVLVAIGVVSEIFQWSDRILTGLAGDTWDSGGLPPVMLACVAVIGGAIVAAGIASAVPARSSETARKVALGCMVAAGVALVVMFFIERHYVA